MSADAVLSFPPDYIPTITHELKEVRKQVGKVLHDHRELSERMENLTAAFTNTISHKKRLSSLEPPPDSAEQFQYEYVLSTVNLIPLKRQG